MNDMIPKFLDGQLSYGYDSVLCDTSYPCPNVATSATAGPASLIQTHLAPFLVAIPIYANPETGDLVFLFSLPIIDANIYRLKDVVNVGFWQGNTYVKIHTPEVIAYHDNNEQLYLAPNLKMGMLTKDIHSLYPSKPCVRDNTKGICGLESIRPDTNCPAEATPGSQVEVTQAEIMGNRWLVNTPARTATLTYDQHDTATSISLPNQTLWITVLKGSILHRLFRRGKPDQEPKPENLTNLIEIMPIPPRRTPDN